MKTSHVLTAFAALLPLVLTAGWKRTYGEGTAYFVQQTSDEDYIAVGENLDGFGNILLVKTDPKGDTIWTRTYGDTAELVYDRGLCVRETADSGYVMLCYSSSFVGNPPASPYLMKTDYNGDSLWARSCGESTKGSSFEQTSDGGYIIVGTVTLYNPLAFQQVYLVKTDSLGNEVWSRHYGWGGTEYGYCVEQTRDGGYIIAGCTGKEFWLIKTYSNGNTDFAIDESSSERRDWEVVSPIAPQITLRYSDQPSGFHASVYDAAGRKVDELGSPSESGVLIWGPQINPRFVRKNPQKV